MSIRKKSSPAPSLPEELVTAWSAIWVNRARPYALQQVDGTYRWVHDTANGATLAAHLAGTATLALSSADAEGMAKWACIDVDQDVTPDVLLWLRDSLAARGLPSTLEGSRRGGHLWLVFTGVVPVAILRTGILDHLHTLEAAGVEVPAYELYPEPWTNSALGHAVRYPLGIHRLTGIRYPLFDAGGLPCVFTTVAAGLRALVSVPNIPVNILTGHRLADESLPEGPAVSDDGYVLPTAHTTSTRSLMIRWVDAHISPMDLLAEYAPDTQIRRRGQGYLGWCPFHDDKAPDERGQAGTPSFYAVQNAMYGWSWRCLSTNCTHHEGPMRHSFRLFQELNHLDVAGAIGLAVLRWPEADA